MERPLTLRAKIGNIIFDHDTPASRGFDLVLLIAILLSIFLIMLDSVEAYRLRFGTTLRLLEWGFTLLFTVEYIMRIYTARKRAKYVFSFFGIVDLLSVLPSYVGLVVAGPRYFIVIRALRLLRIFRILKLAQFLGEANSLARALRASRPKIIVFMVTVLTLVVIIGSLMYLIEGPEHGFDNIPVAVYWAIVTLTTVGYGDVSPMTPLGRFVAGVVMILGYAIIAVPTGIVSVELSRTEPFAARVCPDCGRDEHAPDAVYCRYCASKLDVTKYQDQA